MLVIVLLDLTLSLGALDDRLLLLRQGKNVDRCVFDITQYP